MLIHFNSMHNIVCDTEKPATKPQKWSIKNQHDKLAQRCASVFPARKSRGLGASTDFHLLTVRHVILRHVLVASRSSRERFHRSFSMSTMHAYFAIHFKRTLPRSTMFAIYILLTYNGENPVKNEENQARDNSIQS